MQSYTITKIRTLAEAGALQHAEVKGVPGGWVVHFIIGMQPVIMREIRRNQPRLFTTLDGAAKTLRKMGIQKVVVDQTKYTEEGLGF